MLFSQKSGEFCQCPDTNAIFNHVRIEAGAVMVPDTHYLQIPSLNF